jgi:hypothetical protein
VTGSATTSEAMTATMREAQGAEEGSLHAGQEEDRKNTMATTKLA